MIPLNRGKAEQHMIGIHFRVEFQKHDELGYVSYVQDIWAPSEAEAIDKGIILLVNEHPTDFEGYALQRPVQRIERKLQ